MEKIIVDSDYDMIRKAEIVFSHNICAHNLALQISNKERKIVDVIDKLSLSS